MKTIKQRQREVERKIERIALYQGRRVTEIEQIIEESLEPVLPNKLGMFFDAVISFDTFEPEEKFFNLEEVEKYIGDSHRITEIAEEKENEELQFHRDELDEINSTEHYYDHQSKTYF